MVCLFLTLPLACSSNDPQPGCNAVNAGDCTRVLFVGNSYTTVNDLPTVFAKLAASTGRRIDTGTVTQDGATLAEHLSSGAVQSKLAAAKWNVVVLQEQSEIPAVEQSRQLQMYPAARQLVGAVSDAGALPIFFLTWAHRDGLPANGLTTYAAMQSAITDGYSAIAREQRVAIAPVGVAWSTTLTQAPQIDLWQTDGSHPAKAGTYLAACVLYATMFKLSPVGLSYHGGLSEKDATHLQQIASDTVLTDQAKWGLP